MSGWTGWAVSEPLAGQVEERQSEATKKELSEVGLVGLLHGGWAGGVGTRGGASGDFSEGEGL